MLRLAGIPVRAEDRTERHPLVVIGGAVTFVNPEPLAPFADVIAAGEGRGARPVLRPRVHRRDQPGGSAGAPVGRARLLRAVPLRAALRPRRRAGRVRERRRRNARAGDSQSRAGRTDACDPPATSIFTPDTEFGSRFLVEVVRGCANLCRFCWAGYNYLPVRRSRRTRILQLAEAARVHAPRVGLVSIALCDHPDIERILARLNETRLRDQPRVAAARRPDRDDRPAPARERRTHDHDRAGNRDPIACAA